MPGVAPLDLFVVDGRDDKTVDFRDDRRLIVSLPGRYSLADGNNRPNAGGKRRLFSWRAINISTRAIALLAPVTAKVGTPVIAEIEQLWRLEGSIIREFKKGFAISVAANDEQCEMLAAKIDWIEQNKEFEIVDNRAHACFIPRRPHSLLMIADGSIIPCFVIDISISGAGVSADIMPKVGTVLAVGKVVGRVARHFSGGFAVHFVDVQDREEVEALVTRA